MDVIETREQLQDKIKQLKRANNSIGFVPTMGALHEGHISLIQCCKKENDITVVSIFVNPAQFNEREDYEKYPRDVNKDLKWLEAESCNIVFNPSEKEMYPEPDTRVFDFGELDKKLEGYYRPGHFNGVAKVVSKLFDFVKPHRAYFGEKDLQQLAVVRELAKREQPELEVIGCPIIREEDGLAMSSRNKRLNSEERKNAAEISWVLYASKDKAATMSVQELKNWVLDHLNKNTFINVEYFDIVDENKFSLIRNWNDSQSIRGVIAAWIGNVRLIDNIKYK